MHSPIKLSKCWQLAKAPHLLFMCQPLFRRGHAEEAKALTWPKRFYLEIQLDGGIDVHWHLEKPSTAPVQAGLVQYIRKHAHPTVLTKMLLDSKRGDIWLVLSRSAQEQPWYLQLAHTRPTELRLINNEQQIVYRQSQRSTFTKRKAQEVFLPDPSDHCEDLFAAGIQALAKLDQQEDKDPQDTLEPGPKLSARDQDHEQQEQEEEQDAENRNTSSTGPSSEQRDLRKRLRRRLKTLNKSLTKLLSTLPKPADIQRHKQEADLLQAYSYRIEEGSFHATFSAEETPDQLPWELTLDPHKGLGHQINDRYKELKRLEKTRTYSDQNQKQLTRNIEQLEKDIARLSEDTLDATELTLLASSHKLRLNPELTSQEQHARPSPATRGLAHPSQQRQAYRTFFSRQGIPIRVGKGAQDNDLLTKQAAGNDIWLHVPQVSGSHVVVARKDLQGADLDAYSLREACILALHYSKRKNDLAGEVLVTEKRHVKKRKGMPPGQWLVEKGKTQFVTYTQADLKALLARLAPS